MEVSINGFENYSITDDGQVISKHLNRPICQWVDNVGYKQVKLFKEGKWYYRRVHRLVAEHFIPNPENLPFVNHKKSGSEGKLDNSIHNLEWIDNGRNTQQGYDDGVYRNKYRIPVLVYNKNLELLYEFKSIRELSDTLNLNRKTVSNILNGTKLTNNYEYIFKYKS